ncbi:MAG: MFS transporter [Candidatus Odinarchaeota archaeon]
MLPGSNSKFSYFWHSTNRNVKLVFLFTFFTSIGRSMWAGDVLSVFIKVLTDSNVILGLVSTVGGLATTLVLVPSGLLADFWRKDGMIKIGAVTGLIGLAFILMARTIDFIVFGMIFWGFFQGLTRPSVNTLLADSTFAGNRSKVYSQVFFVRQLGMSLGPFLNVFLFIFLGDIWEIPVMKTVIVVGTLFSIISVVFSLFMDDNLSLGEESEALNQQTKGNGNGNNNGLKISALADYAIPVILIVSSLLIGIGAGMTVRFFSVFFKEQYLMLPVLVNTVTGTTTVATASLSIVAQRIAVRIGRVETMIFFQGTAVLALVGIIFYPPIIVLIPLYIYRGATMNATNPLNRSITMDYIPKRHRGKWNALDQLSFSLFWNLSAGIGGFIIGSENNFRSCFSLTAILYTIATLILLLLVGKVEREKRQ